MKTPREQFEKLTESQETKKQALLGKVQDEAIKTNKTISKIIENSGSLTPQIINNCKQAKEDLESLFKKYEIDEDLYKESLDYMISQEFFSRLKISKEQIENNALLLEEMDKLGVYPAKFIEKFGEIVTRLGDDGYSGTDYYSLFSETLSNGVWLLEYYPRENKYRIQQVVVGKVDSTAGNPDFNYEIDVFKTGNKLVNEFKKMGLNVTTSMTEEYVQIDFNEEERIDIKGIQKIFELLKKYEISFGNNESESFIDDNAQSQIKKACIIIGD